jgi:hypothetical protein
MQAPDFLGIGMERAGTSWLFTMLASHPEIWVPPIKELHYFDVIAPDMYAKHRRHREHLLARCKQKAAIFWKCKTRPEFYKNNAPEYFDWDRRFFTGPMDDGWYRSLFDEKFTRGRVSGEITPAYCNLSKEMITHVHKLNPEMKFILMVRDPAERAWSGMVHQFCHIEGRRFETISEEEMLTYLKGSYARSRSNLPEILETWQSTVPEARLFIRSISALKEEPERLLREVYTFLKVDAEYLPPPGLVHRQINKHTKRSYEKPGAVKEYLDKTYKDQRVSFTATQRTS